MRGGWLPLAYVRSAGAVYGAQRDGDVVVACVSGWRDTALLRGCLESVAIAGWPAIYLDGAYETFLPGATPEQWTTPHEDLDSAVDGLLGVVCIRARRDRMWVNEAEKKSILVDYAWWLHGRLDAEWALFLDTDERVEVRSPSVLNDWLSKQRHLLWCDVNIWRPEHNNDPGGFPIPRLLRLRSDLEFRSPRDFDVFCAGERIAYLDGEKVPVSLSRRHESVPLDLLRIRHDRHERSSDRIAQNGEYQRRRRIEHGV